MAIANRVSLQQPEEKGRKSVWYMESNSNGAHSDGYLLEATEELRFSMTPILTLHEQPAYKREHRNWTETGTMVGSYTTLILLTKKFVLLFILLLFK